ncbi:MAG: aldehyde dehydrogenase family protein [Opitutaceae bacterium]
MIDVLLRQRRYFDGGDTVSLDFRREQLTILSQTIVANRDRILAALQEDLGKSPIEAYSGEIGFVLRDIDHAIRHLPQWMEPEKRRTPWMTAPSRAEVRPDPLGVVLILGPWNYPFQLLLSPLVGALAAGNCVCLKPSEKAPATAEVIRSLMEGAFSPDYVTVCPGGAAVAADLVALPFDHIFFTGSGGVGRKVLASAAGNLTPVTLELGGKSPCVVTGGANLRLSARRIMWGKILNAGQTCVAPDHVLVEASVRDRLLEELKAASHAMIPRRPPEARPADYGRMIDEAHFDRMEGFLEQGEIHSGGERDRETLVFCPTILVDVEPGASVMEEEIFGPVLPVLPCDGLDEAVSVIRSRPKPLAAYLFSSDGNEMDRFKAEVFSGSIGINDTISQIFPADLPLGGVGASGFGSYRGKAGFDTFSHRKSVLQRGTFLDPGFRYPPHGTDLKRVIQGYPWLMR